MDPANRPLVRRPAGRLTQLELPADDFEPDLESDFEPDLESDFEELLDDESDADDFESAFELVELESLDELLSDELELLASDDEELVDELDDLEPERASFR